MANLPTSRYSEVQKATPIEVFDLIAKFKADTDPTKVNLSVGAYRDGDGKPWVLPVVRTVEAQMVTDETLNHEYLPVAGLQDFRDSATKLLLGEDRPALLQNRATGVQAPGGTGALKLAALFLKQNMNYDIVYVSNPTWGNHKTVFKSAGFSQIREYRYWKAETRGFDCEGMLEDLRNAPSESVVVLHAVAHNPTGIDPTQDQWKQIAALIKEKNIFIVMDIAYQGFTSGDVDKDAWAARYFCDEGFEFFIAQSFSKNFGLYNERVGNLCIVANDAGSKDRVFSQMELHVRYAWSNPPNHGGRIVATVLGNPALYSQWKENIKTMSDRVKQMRKELHQKLKALGVPGNWDHIVQQQGMFSYTGLNQAQSLEMVSKYHIYMMKSGRINMCGLTDKNVDYVAKCIHKVVAGPSDKQEQQHQQGRL